MVWYKIGFIHVGKLKFCQENLQNLATKLCDLLLYRRKSIYMYVLKCLILCRMKTLMQKCVLIESSKTCVLFLATVINMQSTKIYAITLA